MDVKKGLEGVTIKPLSLSCNRLLIYTAVYFTVVVNYPFLTGFISAILKLSEFKFLFLLSVPVFLCGLLTLLFSVFSVKYIIKPVLVSLTLISSLVLYAAVNYGVVFDYGMIENSVETNSAEAFSYLNTELIVFFAVFGLAPAWLIASSQITYRPLLGETLDRLKLVATAMITVIVIGYFFYQDYAAVGRNNSHLKKFLTPSQYLSSSFKYAKRNYFDEPLIYRVLDEAPISLNPEQKQVVVLVVGETARASNFSNIGYNKPTNSHTSPYSPVSFAHMTACGTATAVSVPCMFSSLTRENFDRRTADHQQNLVDVLQLAGVDVLWIDNNGCKSVCNRVPTTKIDKQQNSPLCDGEYCQDEALLPPLADKLKQLNRNKTLVVLHMMGSHGPTYYKRYPDAHKKFVPDCQRSDIQNCSSEELVNTYDNTIAYTDFVLSEVIKQLHALPSSYQKSMMYVSDHGESLGESGAYLHGFPYSIAPEEQKHIPMMFWQQATANHAVNAQQQSCLRAIAKSEAVSHDNFYHSVLGLFAVSAKPYRESLDLFARCS